MNDPLRDPITWFIPVFIVSILIEAWLAVRRGQDLYGKQDTLACLAMGIGNLIIAAPLKLVWFALYTLVYQFKLFSIPHNAVWAWALLFFADDVCYYVFHRAHHEVRIFWCTHVNHHSSERYNLAVALRQPWTEAITSPGFWLLLPLLGFEPWMVMTQQAINLVYQFFVHTQTVKQLPRWVEWVFNTPSHHRVHHGTNPEYIDRNYGGILIIWDRLFGSFEPERAPVRYGLTHNLSTYNPFRIAFHEWVAMAKELWKGPDWATRRRALFGKPGANEAHTAATAG